MLERLGYVVTIQTSPGEALAAVQDQPAAFDLVITDLTMPDMDGAKLGAQLLQLQPRLPIIIMTGYSGVLTGEKVRQLGFRELLNKPISLRTLGETVHRVLHQTAFASPSTPLGTTPSEALIAQKAYELWLAQGRESGCDEKILVRSQKAVAKHIAECTPRCSLWMTIGDDSNFPLFHQHCLMANSVSAPPHFDRSISSNVMNWNLKNRITVPTVALIVVMAATISLVSFVKSGTMLGNILKTQLKEQCATSIAQVEDWMEAQQQNLLQLTFAPAVAASLQNTPETPTNRTIASAEMVHARQLHPCYQDINLADTTGLSVASSNPNSVGKLNVSDRQYFKDACAGKTVISQVLASRTTGNPIVVVATPMKEGETVRGVLYIALDLNKFSSTFISSQKVLQTGYAFMFDEQGVVIAHPDKAKIFKTKLTDFDWGRKMLAMRTGELRYVFDGVDKCTILKTSDSLHWGLGFTMPTAELNAPVYQMGKINLALSLCAVAVGIVIMALTARSIARPLRRLADDLLAGAGQTTSAAGQVSASSQSLAEGASEQAASLEETSSSLEEMATMTKRNAENARQGQRAGQGSARRRRQGRGRHANHGRRDGRHKSIQRRHRQNHQDHR